MRFVLCCCVRFFVFFFFNDTATTEIYTLSLHDALPISPEVQPVRFPEDEAPHNMLTEWWYYTGHLFTPEGSRYGFEYVFFQAQRADFPPYYAAHFAITDSANQRFVFDERLGSDVVQPAERGFNLKIDTWTMSGALGEDRLVADMD